ncbi:MAG: zinc-ribbon domain-containing protein [Ignavibacteriales bacterium]|nr:zinc-ribbon domain-containing protein [Ignavibacteriales bacterium]
MFCPKCGNQNSEEVKFCSNCGNSLVSVNTQRLSTHAFEESEEKDTPVALIIITWLLIIFSLFPMGQVSLLISIAILFCSVLLLFSKNSTGKTNGWVVLIIWIITFIIGFLGALNKGIHYN